MLVEVVAAQQFPFSPPDRLSSAELHGFLGAMEQGLDTGTTRTKVPFSHNHFHDLESLGWVAVWVLVWVVFLKLLLGRDTVS
jgi:hypothetical protein